MSISRRGVLAAGLAVTVAALLGAWSGLSADAAQVRPAGALPSGPPPPLPPTLLPPTLLPPTLLPPTLLPWGAKPAPLRLGAAGTSGTALAAAGADAAPATGPVTKPGAPKAPPPGGPRTLAAAAELEYLYGTARQIAAAEGAYATMTIGRPEVAVGDYHSLAEIAVQSADAHQVVEVGWHVDPGIYGDAEPHLFVFNWVNSVPTCYNTCGFVPSATATIRPGAILPVGAVGTFGVQHLNGGWWISYNTALIGAFPDSLWSGAYTRSGLTQWFGEVAAATTLPCTEMGKHFTAASTSLASFTEISLVNGPTTAVTVLPATGNVYSTQQISGTAFRYGGPGDC